MRTAGKATTEYQPFPDEEGRNARQARLEVPALVRALGLPSGARMLEVGCGRGIALPVLAQLCAPRSLVEDDSFDVVIDFGTLFHIARADDAAAEIGRVLAPGGLFVHETKLSQVLSHPVRSRGRRLPSLRSHGLRPRRSAVLWASRAQAS